MIVKELRNDKIIKDWLSGIKAADNTAESYLTAMQAFTEYTKKKPLQLIEEAEYEIKSGLLMRERNITIHLREFRELLENKGRAPLTIKNRVNAVCSFYKSYNIQLPVLPRSMQKAKPQPKRRDTPTKEDIQQVLTHADLLERAIILTGVSSGLSVNEIANLKVRDFTDGYDPQTGITTLHLVRQKVNYEFTTFLSPEASKAVQAYLDYRGREPKSNRTAQFNQLKKQRVILDKDGKPAKHGYLFVARIVSKEYLRIKKELEKEEIRKLDRLSILAMYRRLNEEAQKSAEHGEWNLIRSHAMRKFFNSALLNAGASMFFVDYLCGHTLDATHDAYYRANPESLKEEYKKYVPYITVEKALDPEQHPDFIRLKKESETYARAAANAAVERNTIIQLQADMERMKEELAASRSIKEGYMQFADINEIIEMKNTLKQELEEFSKLKETTLKNGK